ncbi:MULTISPECIES: 50S ribosomal protein L13 [Porphyromonadaceae]|uniref:Large ribosomal subunit protein uL13 n=1 Tax=Sanguibacteroides justesenii TaxID=1547597 RepID=A0A0C3RGA8_9PORP|nr:MULTISPECIES: 50S ribosomal protein L13 [Porphyromonadaceae]KIO44474.1 50S ribosomal protein L13 [Sanguibacteroides justesenii]KIO45270.1 50S ribosomal protein L13 [Sanguibacteroides justesenii]MCR9011223.1 50S ribosomal protein L13 [Gabonibacter chumensis]PXZ44560.1 50S ribosomal protein L13 [Sanguibacteroides justesenii]
MDQISYKTISVNKATAKKEWVLIDAENEVLGRLASKVAKLLRGKYKPSYTPHVDCGDNVIIINVEKVQLTGKKLTDKQYIRHTQYPGGQRISTPQQLLAKHPERIIEHAVKGMLPKNRLGRAVMKNLYLYAGTEHKQEAQQPKVIDLNSLK